MPQENTSPQNNANQPIGTATIVYGTVKDIADNGTVRVLQPNSQVFANDRIMTGSDGMISIVFGDAANTQLDLGRMSDTTLDEDVFQGDITFDPTDATAEVEQIQEALLAGEFDPTTELEAPAAGPPAAGGVANAGGGSSFVVFDLTGEEVTPDSGAETTGVSLNFLDPEAAVLEAGVAPAATVATTPTPTADDGAPTAGIFLSAIDEENLADGTAPATELTTITGTFDDLDIDFGPNGPGGINFGSGLFAIDNLGGGAVDSITIAGTHGNLTIFDNGTWSYNLPDNISHPNANAAGAADILPDVFDYTITDSDGDPADGTITINILDDSPEVVGSITRVVEEEAMEGLSVTAAYPTLSNGNPDEEDGPEDSDFNTPFQNDAAQVTGDLHSIVVMGADNPGTFGIDLALGTPPPLASMGAEVLYKMNANGTTMEAYVEDSYEQTPATDVRLEDVEGERIVFTLDVQADGTYTFTIYDQLDHVVGDGENTELQLFGGGDPVSSIDFSSIVTATDTDLDLITLGANSFTFIIVDDVPILVPIEAIPENETDIQGSIQGGVATFNVDEDALNNSTPFPNNPDKDQSTGNQDSTADTDSSHLNLSALVKIGADEYLTWSLEPTVSEVPDGDTIDATSYLSSYSSHGEEIYYDISGNTLTGYTSSVANVFTFTVDQWGNATFNLNDQIDHDDASGDSGILTISDLGQFVRATDFDGDSVELTGRIAVNVENDVPEGIGKPVVGIVDEDDLDTNWSTGTDDADPAADGPVVATNGSLTSLVSGGADDPLTFGLDTTGTGNDQELSTAANQFLINQGLTSQGDDLRFNINNNGILVAKAGSNADGDKRVVFKLEVKENGDYKFKLFDQLDHKDGDGENSLFIDFTSIVTATDFDMDAVNLGNLDHDGTAFSVEVVDDVPEVTDPSGFSVIYQNEYAGYNNIVGIYELDESGNPINPQIIMDSSDAFKDHPGDELTFSTPYTNDVKIFIIADGGKNIADVNGAQLTFGTDINGNTILYVDAEDYAATYNKGVYFMDKELNVDEEDHFALHPEGGGWVFVEDLQNPGLGTSNLGIEDQSGDFSDYGENSDHDYNDTILKLVPGLGVRESALDDGTLPSEIAKTVQGNFLEDGNIKIGADEHVTLLINGESIILDGLSSSITVGGSVPGADSSSAGQLTIESDGSWTYQLMDNTVTHPDENATEVGDAVVDHFEIDVEDFDGDSVLMNLNIKIYDDGPVVEAPAQDAILVDEAGNSLVADLNIDFGADGAASVVITPTTELTTIGGEQAEWQDNGDGSWSAVAVTGGKVFFTVEPEVIGGEFTGNYYVEQENDLNGEASFSLDITNNGGGNATTRVLSDQGATATFSAFNPNNPGGQPDKVNWSQQGMGVSNEFIDYGGATEILTMVLTDALGDPYFTNDLVIGIDHLDAHSVGSEEVAVIIASNSTTGQSHEIHVTGESLGSGDEADQSFTLNAPFSYDTVEFTSSPDNDSDYRVTAVDGASPTSEDYSFDFVAEVTDGDGDSETTSFNVTFDDDGNVVGDSGDEVISGSSEDDNLKGGGGDDIIYGHGGEDTIYGGSGADSLSGGTGADTIFGNSGDDTIQGDGGADELRGGSGSDSIEGGGGADDLYGGSENDQLYGDSGKDELFGGKGDDQLIGGLGKDELHGGADKDTLVGDKVNFSTPGDPVIIEDDKSDTIDGNAGADKGGNAADSTGNTDSFSSVGPVSDDIDTLIPPPEDI